MVGGTNVELGPRKCDLTSGQVLELGFGHLECGFYGRIVLPSLIKVGDEVALLPNSTRTADQSSPTALSTLTSSCSDFSEVFSGGSGTFFVTNAGISLPSTSG